MFEENKTIGRRFFEEQDRRKGPLPAELCAANYRFHIPGSPPIDQQGHSQFATMFYAAFPDLEHIIEDTVAEDGKAVVRFTLHGTHKGDFMGIPPTGKEVWVDCMAILQIADGKITEVHGMFDQFGMMQQLGVIPAREQPATERTR